MHFITSTKSGKIAAKFVSRVLKMILLADADDAIFLRNHSRAD